MSIACCPSDDSVQIAELSELTRKHTAFDSFDEMLEPHTTYFPSLYPGTGATEPEKAELRRLADAYDAAQAARGDARRAYRGH